MTDKQTTGPCAKRHVTCRIVIDKHTHFVGTNDCNNPQKTCPRLPGDDYTKCRTICDQPSHAEVSAVKLAIAAGYDLHGKRAYLSGIKWICQHCREITEKAGIERIYVDYKQV